MSKNQNNREDIPAGSHSSQMPHVIFRQVAGPYDEKLRKRDVRPEYRERHQKIAEMMNVPRRQNRGERLLVHEPPNKENAERECGQNCTDDPPIAVLGGLPFRIQ